MRPNPRLKLDILLRYEELGRQAKQIERERAEIRHQVEEAQGHLETGSRIGVLVARTRRTVAGLDRLEEAGLLPLLERNELIWTVKYMVLEIHEKAAKVRRRKAG